MDEDYYSSSANGETADDSITDIASLNITGKGYIARMATFVAGSGGENYQTVNVYNNDGTAVNYVVKNEDKNYDEPLVLDTTPVTSDYYTWEVTDGVGTLTVENDLIFNSGIEISEVTSVNIIANGKLTISGRDTRGNLVVSGDLNIKGDLVVTEYIDIDGKLTVDGNLVTGAVFAKNMEVETGATVNLLGEVSDDDGKMYALRLSDASTTPSLTLGTDLSILTSGVSYAIGTTDISGTDYNIGTFINEGDTPDFSTAWYNIATAVSIGKPVSPSTGGSSSSSSSSSTTTSADTTTNDDGSVTATVASTSKTLNGTTSVTVKDSDVETAIESAIEEADGEDAHIEIAVTTKSSTETIEVALSTDALSAIADSDVETLTITSDMATVEIPTDALAEILDQATGDDVTITIALVDADDALTTDQQTMVGSGTVVQLTITSDDETISTFGGEKITLSIPYELQEGEDPDKVVVWHIALDGTITVLPTTYNEETSMATFTTTHFSTFVALHDINEFEDVEPNDYFYTPVIWAVENEVTTGFTDTTFAPENSCTRAEAVTFLYRAYGEPEVTGELTFTDVAADIWYADAVIWAVEMGITNGTGEGIFDPNAECTRAEIVSFLYRAAGEPEMPATTEFADVATGVWYADAVEWAVENDVTNGTGDGNFEPSTNCTRGQIVTFLYRAMAE